MGVRPVLFAAYAVSFIGLAFGHASSSSITGTVPDPTGPGLMTSVRENLDLRGDTNATVHVTLEPGTGNDRREIQPGLKVTF